MTPTVVIISCPQDIHAHGMCEALERKGARAQFLYTPDFPERLSLTIKQTGQGATLISSGSTQMEFGADCVSVWLRRPFFAKTPDEFPESDRFFIERECRDMRANFFDLLCPSALWVNPIHSYYAEHKARQLAAAQRCGLRTPPTLISNDPVEIAEFFQAAGGRLVYKTFNAFVPASLLTEELLAERDTLRWTPGIYQRYIDKDYELRVTVIGRRMFAARINSQQTTTGMTDWREAQWKPRGQPRDLTFEPSTLPLHIEQACGRLMRSLGLAFGAIDLIMTPEKEYVFLEVNPSGQFLWAEYEVGLPLLDAMSEMLLQGDVQYKWNRRTPGVLFDADFLAVAEERRHLSMVEHVCELQR